MVLTPKNAVSGVRFSVRVGSCSPGLSHMSPSTRTSQISIGHSYHDAPITVSSISHPKKWAHDHDMRYPHEASFASAPGISGRVSSANHAQAKRVHTTTRHIPIRVLPWGTPPMYRPLGACRLGSQFPGFHVHIRPICATGLPAVAGKKRARDHSAYIPIRYLPLDVHPTSWGIRPSCALELSTCVLLVSLPIQCPFIKQQSIHFHQPLGVYRLGSRYLGSFHGGGVCDPAVSLPISNREKACTRPRQYVPTRHPLPTSLHIATLSTVQYDSHDRKAKSGHTIIISSYILIRSSSMEHATDFISTVAEPWESIDSDRGTRHVSMYAVLLLPCCWLPNDQRRTRVHTTMAPRCSHRAPTLDGIPHIRTAIRLAILYLPMSSEQKACTRLPNRSNLNSG